MSEVLDMLTGPVLPIADMSKQGRLWAAKCRVAPRDAAREFRRHLEEEGSVIAAASAMGLTRSTVYYMAREIPEIGAEIDRLRDRQEGKSG